jgi:hypothetical protein
VTLDAEIGGVVPNLQGGRRAAFLVGDDIKISIAPAVLQAEAAATRVRAASAA